MTVFGVSGQIGAVNDGLYVWIVQGHNYELADRVTECCRVSSMPNMWPSQMCSYESQPISPMQMLQELAVSPLMWQKVGSQKNQQRVPGSKPESSTYDNFVSWENFIQFIKNAHLLSLCKFFTLSLIRIQQCALQHLKIHKRWQFFYSLIVHSSIHWFMHKLFGLVKELTGFSLCSMVQ